MNLKKVLIIGKFKKSFLQFLNKNFLLTYYENSIDSSKLNSIISNYEILILRGRTKIHNEDFFKKAKKLKLIIRPGSGVDNINLDLLEKYNIELKNIKGVNANSVSELVIGLMINLSRKIISAHSSIYENQWNRENLYGTELLKKNLLIIGFGSIGQILAQKAHAFGMKIFFYDPFILQNPFYYAKSIKTLSSGLKLADFISLHLPSNPKNVNLIAKDEFMLMNEKKPYLINSSRADIINEEALMLAIQNNQIKGIALDVFNKEPFFLNEFHGNNLFKKYPEKVILTPHIGGLTEEAESNITNSMKKILLDYININERK